MRVSINRNLLAHEFCVFMRTNNLNPSKISKVTGVHRSSIIRVLAGLGIGSDPMLVLMHYADLKIEPFIVEDMNDEGGQRRLNI